MKSEKENGAEKAADDQPIAANPNKRSTRGVVCK